MTETETTFETETGTTGTTKTAKAEVEELEGGDQSDLPEYLDGTLRPGFPVFVNRLQWEDIGKWIIDFKYPTFNPDKVYKAHRCNILRVATVVHNPRIKCAECTYLLKQHEGRIVDESYGEYANRWYCQGCIHRFQTCSVCETLQIQGRAFREEEGEFMNRTRWVCNECLRTCTRCEEKERGDNGEFDTLDNEWYCIDCLNQCGDRKCRKQRSIDHGRIDDLDGKWYCMLCCMVCPECDKSRCWKHLEYRKTRRDWNCTQCKKERLRRILRKIKIIENERDEKVRTENEAKMEEEQKELDEWKEKMDKLKIEKREQKLKQKEEEKARKKREKEEGEGESESETDTDEESESEFSDSEIPSESDTETDDEDEEDEEDELDGEKPDEEDEAKDDENEDE